jgi:hypothetical protein
MNKWLRKKYIKEQSAASNKMLSILVCRREGIEHHFGTANKAFPPEKQRA